MNMKFGNKSKKTIQRNKTDIIGDNSPFAFNEGYKSLRTNLSFATFEGEVKVIVMTSTIPGEGKSSVSINLSRSLAQSGKRVLLIDGDLRSPSLHRYLRIKKNISAGLSSVLVGTASLEEAIYGFPSLDIDVMLSGPIPPNPSELLSRGIMRELTDELKESYDFIIIDTAPAGVVTDAAIIAKWSDGVLYVVRHNYAEKDMIKNATKTIRSTGSNMLGVIVNNYQSSKDVKGNDSYGYQYHYGENNNK